MHSKTLDFADWRVDGVYNKNIRCLKKTVVLTSSTLYLVLLSV